MNKRNFIKTSLLTTLGAATLRPAVAAQPQDKGKTADAKHWIWVSPDPSENPALLWKKYLEWAKAGIKGIFFEQDNENHFRSAKSAGLEAHRWIWTLNRNDEELLKTHPDWYSMNRKGESCATNPPYVGYYRWLCPSKPEVTEFLTNQVKNILLKSYVDGIHLDYIRYCDVVLPVNLWEKYNLIQTSELPEYDFCYCPTCREKYKAQTGADPLDLKYPDQSPSWRRFRYDQVNNLVNHLADVAHQLKKPITAAVFPTPEIAHRLVRQDWTNWNLDGICPMIYHGFYKESVSWIGDAVKEGVNGLCGRVPLYAGLFLSDFKSDEEIHQGITISLQNGASGIVFFGNVDGRVLTIFEQALKENKG